MSRTRTSVRRAVSMVALLGACLGLSACDKPEPTITWFGNGASANVEPALYCELADGGALDCSQTNGPQATLKLHPTDSVQVNIPSEVAEQPWLLVLTYADDTTLYRTPLFEDGETLSYVVHPTPGKQLTQVELWVPTVVPDANGLAQYSPRQAWALVVEAA